LLLGYCSHEIGFRRVRPIEKPRPYLIMPPRGLPERFAVALGIQRLQSSVTAP
jgi:hypothetical protein